VQTVHLPLPVEPLDCGNAGTVLRLASGVLAGQKGRFVLTGDESLSRRPHERVAEPLRQMGARIETTNGGAPVLVEGAQLRPIRYELPVASAQVKSAVLLAGLFAEGGPTVVVERVPTRDHTERLLRELGVGVVRRGADVSVSSIERLAPFPVRVGGTAFISSLTTSMARSPSIEPSSRSRWARCTPSTTR
jgi:3-phosphoshikimate 1-carboxyvinyltransferase